MRNEHGVNAEVKDPKEVLSLITTVRSWPARASELARYVARFTRPCSGPTNFS